MQESSNMEPLSIDGEVKPATLEKVKEEGLLLYCNLFDAEMVYKIAEEFLMGFASACVDNTMGGLWSSPGAVAVDIRQEMVEYLIRRSETFVAESIVLECTPDIGVSANPFDIISDFIDDFAHSKRNFFSHVSVWLSSDRREDRIEDFVEELELNGFWLISQREEVAKTLLRNVDFKTSYHCNMKFKTEDELEQHIASCNFRTVNCVNEGCDAVYSAGKLEEHDSTCPFKTLPCEQKCADIIMRRDMDRHCITVCPMKLVNCPFYPVGCLFTIPQHTVGRHRAENLQSHLICVLKLIHKEASLEALKERAELLEKALSPERLSAAKDARSLTFTIKDHNTKLGPLVGVKKSAESDAEDDKLTNDEDNSMALSPMGKQLYKNEVPTIPQTETQEDIRVTL
ncbi:uncharacterized protein LOC116021727 [Ipomoea triloba]|uniref:uncharacterized protein LOC116021727 n=1 Tax=Ipomoea triloba TaxID=35885 RepID=UPI00125E7854|nr:uncharacterized protein LOC116021727 [Ipomoea triloba]XP_031118053.1 uncharacterized protein LOC116021727 [Ipomoea triloba]XP_031118054.1 uncharacterized protein LOC116021727 [Ipomoea triloba]XP_031118055.1 uncharacterized protein LOC116021727 [Ipomoea triloba]XP_031118056.1 uncharacterized protein LOC116021727 [Ipomoea triloba]